MKRSTLVTMLVTVAGVITLVAMTWSVTRGDGREGSSLVTGVLLLALLGVILMVTRQRERKDGRRRRQ